MATKNKTTDEIEVVENTVTDGEDVSPAERETLVEDAGPTTFTVEVNGEEIELENKWDKSQPPGALMFMGTGTFATKYAPSLLEQLIGEEQVFKLLDAGADTEDMAHVITVWAEDRGLGKSS